MEIVSYDVLLLIKEAQFVKSCCDYLVFHFLRSAKTNMILSQKDLYFISNLFVKLSNQFLSLKRLVATRMLAQGPTAGTEI